MNRFEDKEKRGKTHYATINAVCASSFKESLKNQEESPDTLLRKEMQADIEKMVLNGKSREEILQYLNSESEFEKFSKFFESYVDNKLKPGKCKLKNKVIEFHDKYITKDITINE